jgi:DNA-binding transcriptional regulator YhcF (GntR family)
MIKHLKEEDRLVKAYKAFLNKNSRIPSVRELAKESKFNKSTAERVINRLLAKGIMSNEPGTHRSLTITK